MSKLFAAVALTAVVALAAAPSFAVERVRTATGALQGVTADGVTSFKGVPYAEPPVGSLRWRPPVIKQPWPGVRVADASGAICMQIYNAADNGVGPKPMSEDCLTLNLFAPASAQPGGRLPVMVWIHGGGLVNGSGTAALYDGSALARQGVIVVSINYRLGRFGYFAHPALTAEAGGAAVGNYGLMDQIEALRWVRRNISAFGGDPSNVTIFGESAGGVSVNRLMMVPQAGPLFAKAISQSGAGAERSLTLTQAEAAGAAFAQSLGVTAPTVEALRAIPADAIVKAGDLNMLAGSAPILDGRMLKEDALEAFRAGREAHVPYLVGSNSREIPGTIGGAFRAAGELPPAQNGPVLAAYGSQATFDRHILTDNVFGAPARALAKAHAATGAPTYLYRFSVVSPSVAKRFEGAIHASDRQYVFQTLSTSPWPTDANDAEQAKRISAYWVAFARTGDPGAAGGPVWPRYDRADRLMDFTNAGPQVERTPDAAVLDALSATRAPPR